MRHSLVVLGLSLLVTAPALAQPASSPTAQPSPPSTGSPPLLLQHPSLSRTSIAFDYAGEIWTVPRTGGRAERVVTGEGQLSHPIFSPDGSRIAFTGRYDGNTDVYVVASTGGEPKRLTFHPGADEAVGWTPDGRSVLFRSPRAVPRDLDQLYVVPADGGVPTLLPLPSGEEGSFSPDGSQIAYSPINQWQPAWKGYRGGQTARIWIARLSDSHVTPIPRPNSNDRDPIWVGGKIYFLSDRDGPTTLYAYDPNGGAVTRLVDNAHGFSMASASAGPDGIVIDHFGRLELFHTDTGRLDTVPVTVSADLPQVRPHFETVKPDGIEHARITASGKRVVIEARGEILSVPADKGDVRNLTQSPGVADRDPAPSPDGRSVAYFSDESGDYALRIRPADGLGAVRTIPLGQPGSYFYDIHWSPDSKKLVYHDKRLILWMVDLSGSAKPVKVDTDRFDTPFFRFDPAWSFDSRWIAYTKQLPNHLHAAFAYSLDTGRATQLTDGLSDVAFPRFDRNGKYLYFTASTSVGLGAGWLDMSSMGRAVDGAAYVMVLRKDLPSPVAPQSDEESASEEPRPGPKSTSTHTHHETKIDPAPDAPPDASSDSQAVPASDSDTDKPHGHPSPPARVTIDFDGMDQRIVALPIARANFAGLEVGNEGVIYTLTKPSAQTDEDLQDHEDEPAQTLSRFDFKKRENKTLAANVKPDSFSVSADGTHMLLERKDDWIVAPADAPLKSGKPAGSDSSANSDDKDAQHTLKLDQVSVWVDPRAEWRQMFYETWRIERDFFYDPHLHGLDEQAAIRTYAPFLAGLGARQDLNVLFQEMTGHIAVGHTFIRGGDLPTQPKAKVGLLGADYIVSDGHWKITRILRGENWNPKLVAPLSQPGIQVKEGEFLLAVNGRPVPVDREIHAAFDGLADTRTVLTVGPTADGKGARQVTVVPVASETALRLRTWMEQNRRTADRLSGGKVAYVYLPDTASGGFANFNRYYFAQVGHQAAVIDERFNHGGDIADYIIDQLRRTPQMVNETREGEPIVEPAQAIFGPKVMIINEMSGSGGDALPWLFRKNKVGPLVGERTWGGLVGIGGYPKLMDGGTVTAPRWAIYGTQGQWEVENTGIPPDIEVSADPEEIRKGHDPQLERAVKEAMTLLQQNPPPTFVRPAAPDKHPILPAPG
ncbi:MAG: S41 family peptidase [Janthinobacterium lividum]